MFPPAPRGPTASACTPPPTTWHRLSVSILGKLNDLLHARSAPALKDLDNLYRRAAKDLHGLVTADLHAADLHKRSGAADLHNNLHTMNNKNNLDEISASARLLRCCAPRRLQEDRVHSRLRRSNLICTTFCTT